MDDKTKLIKSVLEKQVSRTTYGNSIYSILWYTDDKNKLCITFTPRGGCSIAFQQYLDLVGLLEDGLNMDPFIHTYRNEIFIKSTTCKDINDLIKEKYTFIKFIMNPYIRAVSIYRIQISHNLSFREYLKQLVNNEIDYFCENDKFHLYPQYIEGEEEIITKYIKINENETYPITLSDGNNYLLNVNKYSSSHHGCKNENNVSFSGDKPLNIIKNDLPKSYKLFYDDEIKKLVDIYYKNDIEKYGFTFDNF